MIPVLIWFLGRIIREVKAIQEGEAMSVGYYSHTEIEGQQGYAIKRLTSSLLQNPGKSGEEEGHVSGTWQLALAEILFAVLLLATHKSYRKRLAKTRIAWSVDLEEFRHLIEEMLAEWTGASCSPTFFFSIKIFKLVNYRH